MVGVLTMKVEIGSYSSVVGNSVHFIEDDGRFAGQIAFLCQTDTLRPKAVQDAMCEVIAEALTKFFASQEASQTDEHKIIKGLNEAIDHSSEGTDPGKVRYWTPLFVAKIEQYRKLASDGHTKASASKIMGVSRERVRQIAIAHGIEFAKPKSSMPDRIFTLHSEGKTLVEIAAQVGCTYETAQVTVKRLGLVPNRPKFPSPRADQIRELAALGMTGTEVARNLGISTAQVSAAKKRYGIVFQRRSAKGATP